MVVTVSKWGNSLGLRLPKALAAELQIVEGTAVAMHIDEGRLVVQRVPTAVTLEALLGRITPDNLQRLHLDQPVRGSASW
ncbi:MAG: AbrB/MazE/SpoVT family DNA-binding domain-containing protein [Gemmatimonas sp.]